MAGNRQNAWSYAQGQTRTSLEIATVEYCVQWNDMAQEWNVLRNGAATDVAASKMRTSVVASAIRDAKAEFASSSGTVTVNCREGRKLETLWKATQ